MVVSFAEQLKQSKRFSHEVPCFHAVVDYHFLVDFSLDQKLDFLEEFLRFSRLIEEVINILLNTLITFIKKTYSQLD